MAKYHHWLKYGEGGKVIEIIIRDDGGAKLDVFKFNSSDKNAIKRALKTIRMKYNIELVEKKGDKDLEWLE